MKAALLAYPWPGNVRELANVMERVTLLSDAREVTADTLGLSAPAVEPPGAPERAAAGISERAPTASRRRCASPTATRTPRASRSRNTC